MNFQEFSLLRKCPASRQCTSTYIHRRVWDRARVTVWAPSTEPPAVNRFEPGAQRQAHLWAGLSGQEAVRYIDTSALPLPCSSAPWTARIGALLSSLTTTWTTMSCCGEATHKAANAQAAQNVTPFPSQPITQQPGPQSNPGWPGSEKTIPIASGPSPPPQVYQNGYGSSPNQQTTFPQYPAVQGSPPPGMYPNGAMPPHTPGSPPPRNAPSPYSAYSSTIQSPPLARTTPDRSVAMSVTSRGQTPPALPQQMSFADEGKLSVSIDFGESPVYAGARRRRSQLP